MSFGSRIYYAWDEAAQVLGLDREGLRQFLEEPWSPTYGNPQKHWLPVTIDSGDLEFIGRLQWNASVGNPEFTWSNRNSFAMNAEYKSDLIFTSGKSFPLRGQNGKQSWSAIHDYETGIHMCFSLYGPLWVLSPEDVINACKNYGRLSNLSVAPIGWCENGFPSDFSFHWINVNNTLYLDRPRNIFDSAKFLNEDICRIKAYLNDPNSEVVDVSSRWPWGDYETNLLRKLAAAGEKFWKRYDPDDKTTAPKNDEVAAWLKKQGVADRTAQVMATILRADNLPTGPRG